MATQIYQIRPTTVGLSYENWQDDASCHELAFELFELQDFDEVERGEQEKSIAEGLKVCSSCPVRAACKANSSELDRHWTTRGGQPPEGLFEDATEPEYKFADNGRGGGFAPNKGIKRPPKQRCKRDHDNWGVKPGDGRRYCLTCAKMNNAARYGRTV